MKTILTAILLLFAMKSQAQHRYLNEPLLHYSYSGLITSSAIGYLHYRGVEKHKAVVYGALIGIGCGLVKETLDRKWDNKDMAYNLAGVASATIIFSIPNSKRK